MSLSSSIWSSFFAAFSNIDLKIIRFVYRFICVQWLFYWIKWFLTLLSWKNLTVTISFVGKRCNFSSTLKVVYVLNTPKPVDKDNKIVAETRERNKWENNDYIYIWHILNGVSDSFFNIYQNKKYVEDLWDKLEARYMPEDATSKKFLGYSF